MKGSHGHTHLEPAQAGLEPHLAGWDFFLNLTQLIFAPSFTQDRDNGAESQKQFLSCLDVGPGQLFV